MTLSYVVILSDVRTISGQVEATEQTDAMRKAIKEIERLANDGFYTRRGESPAIAAFIGGDDVDAQKVIFSVDEETDVMTVDDVQFVL